MKIIKNNISIYLYILICLLYGCKKFNTVVDLKIPDQENVLVLNSLFTNDSTLSVNISKSADFFKKETPEPIGNATCKLYVNGIFVEDLINSGSGNYRSTVIPFSGSTYELKISAAGYKDISAKATLPIAPIIIETQTNIDSAGKLFNYRIKDTDSGKNYYSISLFVLEVDSFGNYINSYPVYLSATNSSDPQNIFGNDDSGTMEYFLDDGLFNGTEFSGAFKFESYDSGYQTDSGFIAPAKTYVSVVKNISEEMFKYKKSLQKQQENSGNPFAEPVLVYNNITNGFGIFAAYSFKLYEVHYK